MAVQFKIQHTFEAWGCCFVMAQLTDKTAKFSVPPKSYLGGIELLRLTGIPRLIRNGEQQYDVFIFEVRNPEYAAKFKTDSLVDLVPGKDFETVEK